MQYTIISEGYLPTFIKETQKHLRLGWEFSGPMVVSAFMQDTVNKHIWFYQPMTLAKPVKVSKKVTKKK